MIYITQLIFVKEGKEDVFLEFESVAVPLITKYNGKITYRVRPTMENFIDCHEDELPFEIHFVVFESEEDLANFMKDDERLAFVHLKEESVKSIILIKGERI